MHPIARVLERSAAKQRAARGDAGTRRGRAGGVRVSKADALKRNAHPFGDHLTLAGAKPLPQLRQSEIDIDAAVVQHLDKRAGDIKPVAIRAEARAAHAHRDADPRRIRPSVPVFAAVVCKFLVKPQFRRRFFHHGADAHLVEI